MKMEHFNWTVAIDNISTTSSLPEYVGRCTLKNSTQVAPMPITIFTVVTAVIVLIMFFMGVLGNTLVIYVVVRYAKMKTVTNLYILNLALADELYILGIPFLCTQSVLSYWPYGNFLCKIYMTADTMSQFTSTFCLTVMSIDRYLAVVHPICSAKWRKPQVAKILNAGMWVVSFLIALPVTIFSRLQEDYNSCNLQWPKHSLWSDGFILYTAILGFFGPLCVIGLCYLLIVIRVRSAGVRAGLTKRRRSERKVTRMVVIIVLVFVLCWLPFFTANLVNLVYTIPETNGTAAIFFTLVIFTYSNSCANPILYCFLSDNFKQSFKKVLCLHKANGGGAVNQQADRSKNNYCPDSQMRSHTKNGGITNVQCVQLEDIGEPDQLKLSML